MSDHREAVKAIARDLVADQWPQLAADFEDFFTVLYEQGGEAELLGQAPDLSEFGQEAMDPEMIRDVGLIALVVFPTCKLMAAVLGRTVADSINYSLKALDGKARLKQATSELIAKYPDARKWILLSSHFCERFLMNLEKELRGKDGKV